MTLHELFKQNRLFFLVFLFFFVVAIFILVTYSKEDGFYLMNTWHVPFFTYVFIYATYLGDGFFCVLVGLLFFMFKKRSLGAMVIATYALSGIIAQVLKYFVVEARPAVLLKDSTYPYFINDVTLHNLHAFPSGHTASAFALAATLSFAAKNKNSSLLFLAGAILVGYSRIYLAQHFMDDVLAGAVIGVMSSIVCQLFLSGPIMRIKFFSDKNDSNAILNS
ncbi:MAG: phosphatase PAP2 family protein [Ginsengibacter sp.]